MNAIEWERTYDGREFKFKIDLCVQRVRECVSVRDRACARLYAGECVCVHYAYHQRSSQNILRAFCFAHSPVEQSEVNERNQLTIVCVRLRTINEHNKIDTRTRQER